jgi:hypothetical protein
LAGTKVIWSIPKNMTMLMPSESLKVFSEEEDDNYYYYYSFISESSDSWKTF